MIKKVLKIQLKEPLLIRDKKGVGNVLQTQDYIPGATLRGALAFAYLKSNNKSVNDDDFKKFFLNGHIRYGFAYPVKNGINYPSLPIPATAYSCKYNAGFIKTAYIEKDHPHGVVDILFPWIFYLINEKGGINFPEKFRKCLTNEWGFQIECAAPLELYDGFYIINRDGNYEKIEIKKRLVQRTAINECTQTAWANKLYSIEFIEKGQDFVSEVWIDDSIVDNFDQFVKNKKEILIGGKKNIASGKATIELKDPVPFPKREELNLRLKYLNNALKHFCQEQGRPLENNFILFTITLHSDTIILDEWFRYKNFIDIEDLKLATNDSNSSILDNFKLFHAWIKTGTIAGWNMAPNYKLPRRNELSIKAGSVFVYVSKKNINNVKLIKLLEKIEENGIGERTYEGFGSIRICDEFHYKGFIGALK